MENREAESDGKLEACIQYFRQRSVFDKLFREMRDKYRSLGRFGGILRLSGLSEEECRQLGGFLQKDYVGKQSVSISAAAMEKALVNSRFSGLEWEKILQGYFREEIVGKKELKQQECTQRNQFFEKIIAAHSSNPGALWLKEVFRTKGEGYRLLMEQYRKQPEKLEDMLSLLLNAIPQLPFLSAGGENTAYELLAVFAAKTTGNPHFFDAGTIGEQLLAAFLRECFFKPFRNPDLSTGDISETFTEEKETGFLEEEKISSYREGETTGFFKAEERAKLFYAAGLLRDELSNNILVYGINGMRKDGKFHEGLGGFVKQREPFLMPLMTIKGLEKVFPQKENRVYIVENPSVFAKLIEAWPDAALLCGNGQIRLAALVLMDLFDKEICFYYAGDYDPEGLQIAQKLKERYGDRLRLWKYHGEFYRKYQSEMETSEKSLKQLDHIVLPELQEISQLMRQQKKAVYQENMLEEYLK